MHETKNGDHFSHQHHSKMVECAFVLDISLPLKAIFKNGKFWTVLSGFPISTEKLVGRASLSGI